MVFLTQVQDFQSLSVWFSQVFYSDACGKYKCQHQSGAEKECGAHKIVEVESLCNAILLWSFDLIKSREQDGDGLVGRCMDIGKCHLCLLQPSRCTINTRWHFIVFLSVQRRILLLKVYQWERSEAAPAGRRHSNPGSSGMGGGLRWVSVLINTSEMGCILFEIWKAVG